MAALMPPTHARPLTRMSAAGMEESIFMKPFHTVQDAVDAAFAAGRRYAAADCRGLGNAYRSRRTFTFFAVRLKF